MRGLCIALGLMLALSPANAQWVYDGMESDFGGDGLHTVITADESYGLAIRCQGENLDLIYVTPEQIDSALLESMSIVVLKIRVDKGEIFALGTKPEIFGGGSSLGFRSEIPERLVNQIAAAKSRVSVVVQVVASKFHEHRFGVSGSSRAIQNLKEKCALFKQAE